MTVLRNTLGAVSLAVARLRVERAATVLIVAIVAATAFVFAGGVLLFDRAADDGLRHALKAAPPVQRNVEFTIFGRIPPGENAPFTAVEEEGRALEAELPASLRQLLRDRSYLVESVDHLLIDAPRPTTRLNLRYQSGIEERVRLAEGRFPGARTQAIVVPDRFNADGEPIEAVVYEAAVSTKTVEELALAVGDRLILTPDPGEQLTNTIGSGNLPYSAVDIVGRFDVLDPDEEYWLNDPTLGTPLEERVSTDISIFHGAVLVAPEAYPSLAEARDSPAGPVALPFRYAWRYFVDPQRVDSPALPDLRAGVARLEAAYPFRSVTDDSDVPSVQTGLAHILAEYDARRSTSESALAVAATGPAGAAAGAIGLVALIQLQRRRGAIALAHGRGASGAQLVAAQVVEGALLAAPAAVVGYLAAVGLTGAAGTPLAVLASAAVAVAAVVVLVLVALPVARSAFAAEVRSGVPGTRERGRQLVFDALVVGVAVAGIALLRGRGAIDPGSATVRGSVDPYVAAVPALAGLAAAVVVRRLYPLPVRVLARAAAWRRGLVPSLALRNASRDPDATRLPLLVVMLATAMAVFASVVVATIDKGQETSSWSEVGADFRIEGPLPDLPPAVDPRIAGVEAVAPLYERSAGLFASAGIRRPVTLVGIDATEYGAVVAGSPIADVMPPPFTGRAWTEGATGTEVDPIPAIITGDLTGSSSFATGGVFEMSLPPDVLTVRLVGTARAFPGLRHDASFLIVPYEALSAAVDRPLPPSRLLVRAPVELDAPLRSAVSEAAPAATVVSRHERYLAFRADPLMGAVNSGFGLGVAVAAAYALLALGGALVLALAARRRQLALLRTLGLSARGVLGLIVLEHGPIAMVALATGVCLGLAVAWVLAPGLELEVFTGAAAALHVDWPGVALLAVAPAALVGVAVLTGTWLVQRTDLARTVRGLDPA